MRNRLSETINQGKLFYKNVKNVRGTPDLFGIFKAIFKDYFLLHFISFFISYFVCELFQMWILEWSYHFIMLD